MNHQQTPNHTTLCLLDGELIEQLLTDDEIAIVEQIRLAYELHQQGESALPHSVFLRFPDAPKNRIIGLPSYLGGHYQSAGMKWIASFPDNVKLGLDRASAILVLNSMANGRSKAILESSIISAKRTAASAALAATRLAPEGYAALGLIGCGPIGFEIVRFILATNPDLRSLLVHDLSEERARNFQHKCQLAFSDLSVETVPELSTILAAAPVVALATTAPEPYIHDLPVGPSRQLILNISLRDLSPDLILNSDNIVDDADHVSRERTSIHLAELKTGNRHFIRGTIADVCLGRIPAADEFTARTVFSPFGLGVLDLALGEYTLAKAQAQGLGLRVGNFFPKPWNAAP